MEPLQHMQKFGKAISFVPPCMKTQKTLLDRVLDAKNMETQTLEMLCHLLITNKWSYLMFGE